MTRRKFLALAGLSLPAAVAADAFWETTSLRVTRLPLNAQGTRRFVHFTDFHFKGDEAYARELVSAINRLEVEFAIFTGDLIEDKSYASAALDFIRQIKVPVYGAPGNHDYWCGASFEDYERAFSETGGAWLVDRSLVLPKYDLELVGMALIGIHALRAPQAGTRVLLNHYPAMADELRGQRFDLILSGHSHGGQVRLPFYGALFLPWGVGPYDLGFFQSGGGPLYVNAGIGTYRYPFRINCRPELTVVTI